MTKSGLKMKGGYSEYNIGTGFWIIGGILLLIVIIFMILFCVYFILAGKVDQTKNPEKYEELHKKSNKFMIICLSFVGVMLVFIMFLGITHGSN
jgi:hypothetical protein